MTAQELQAALLAALSQPSAVRTEAASVEYRAASDLVLLVAALQALTGGKVTAIPVTVVEHDGAV